ARRAIAWFAGSTARRRNGVSRALSSRDLKHWKQRMSRMSTTVAAARARRVEKKAARILIVEDERLVAMSLRRQVHNLGYEVWQSRDPCRDRAASGSDPDGHTPGR